MLNIKEFLKGVKRKITLSPKRGPGRPRKRPAEVDAMVQTEAPEVLEAIASLKKPPRPVEEVSSGDDEDEDLYLPGAVEAAPLEDSGHAPAVPLEDLAAAPLEDSGHAPAVPLEDLANVVEICSSDGETVETVVKVEPGAVKVEPGAVVKVEPGAVKVEPGAVKLELEDASALIPQGQLVLSSQCPSLVAAVVVAVVVVAAVVVAVVAVVVVDRV